MEQFYQLLRTFNIDFIDKHASLPEWFFQYIEEQPPLYWKTIYEILRNEDKSHRIVEIGAGYGDITALLNFMGFKDVLSFEMDGQLIKHITDKIKFLFNYEPNTINQRYPQKLDYRPEILIQVNCIYSDMVANKEEYLKKIREFYEINGIPQIFLFESIDDSYKEVNETFPYYVRLNLNDIRKVFPGCRIQSFPTYSYPVNKVSKTLYKICI